MNILAKFQADWIAKQEAKWQASYAQTESEWQGKLKSLSAELSDKLASYVRDERDIEDLAKRLLDRKEELARVNQDLKDQIRLIEAKASPDQVWITAFSQGFSKAWDMMIPVMSGGLDQVVERTRNQAIDSALANLDSVVVSRLNSAGQTHLQPIHDLLIKKRDFEEKLASAKDSDTKQKYTHYLEALGWALNGNPVSQDEPVSG